MTTEHDCIVCDIRVRKAIHKDLAAVRATLRSFGAEWTEVDKQTDWYFVVPKGQLKLRHSLRHGFQLIAYGDAATFVGDSEASHAMAASLHCVVLAVPASRGEALRAAFESMFGSDVVVSKEREVWLLANVRIHLDRVEQLGTFVELEALPTAASDAQVEEQQLDALLTQIGVLEEDRRAASYRNLRGGASAGC